MIIQDNPKMPLWHEVLIAIQRTRDRHCYTDRIARRVKCARGWVRTLVQRLHQRGLVECIPVGKVKLLKITQKGEGVVKAIIAMRSELGVFT